jgi:hypothetical protein
MRKEKLVSYSKELSGGHLARIPDIWTCNNNSVVSSLKYLMVVTIACNGYVCVSTLFRKWFQKSPNHYNIMPL